MIDRRRLQAPQKGGAILAEPPLAESGRLLAGNRNCFQHFDFDILGRSWSEFRRQARQEVLTAARDYLTEAGEPVPSWQGESLFLAGHQPDLFHPGVWIKNFALCGLAKVHRAIPLNLIVDSDTAKALSIRVPTRLIGSADSRRGQIDPNQFKVILIPIDRWTNEVPFEELRVSDEETFGSVKSKVSPILQEWGIDSIFDSFWQEVTRQGRRTKILGERLAAARRAFERKWNCHNWELPISRLCQTTAFSLFACHLMTNLPRFHSIYNQSIREYRARYGLRSQSHPVPELASKGDWFEAPFWAWRTDQIRRRPLFARQCDDKVQLRLDSELLPVWHRDAEMVNAWQQLERRGIKIRSRALITTLYARVFLGELFIHGIGGGKYDELTDAIIRDFYQVDSPEYLVLSGTLRLPLPALPGRQSDCRRFHRELRDLHWNPQRHLNDPDEHHRATEFNSPGISDEVRDLLSKKKTWIERQPQNAYERQQRFQLIREVTNQLRPMVGDQERRIKEKVAECEWEVQANAILQNRDYAFCLHPEKTLRPFVTQFL